MRFVLYNIRYGTWRKAANWPLGGYLGRTTATTMKIAGFLKELQPDIVGLVEVDSGSYRTGGRDQAEVIARELGHFHAYESKYESSHLVYRMFPILRNQGNAFLASDMIRSPRFHYFDRGIKRLVIELDLPDLTIFLVHLSLGAATRHHQLGDLYELVRNCSRPKIVAGDFNVAYGQREMKLFLAATGLKTANEANRLTFPSGAPRYELDFVLYGEGVKPVACSVPDIQLSDHLPIVFDFKTEA